jgi:hypothetical protein
MNFRDFFTAYCRQGRLFRQLTVFSLLVSFGLGIIGYAGNFLDTDDIPFLALQSVHFISNNDKAAAIQFIEESVSLTFINKNSLLTRAPPLRFVRSA